MKLSILKTLILSAAFLGLTHQAQAASKHVLNCRADMARFAFKGEGLPGKVIESKEITKACALGSDPEVGFGGDCSFTAFNKLKVEVQANATDLELTATLSPIRVTANGSETVGFLTFWDERTETQYSVFCRVD